MLNQNQFTDLLQRFINGQNTPEEQHLLERWLAQPMQHHHAVLTAAELSRVREAMWQRIEQAMQEG